MAVGAGAGSVVHFPDLDNLHGNIVADLPLFRLGNQPFAGFAGMRFDDRVQDFVVEQESIKSVRTLKNNVVLCKSSVVMS